MINIALLVVILPLAFEYLLEIQAEYMKMQASTLIITKWTVDSTKCEHHDHDHNHLLFLCNPFQNFFITFRSTPSA